MLPIYIWVKYLIKKLVIALAVAMTLAVVPVAATHTMDHYSTVSSADASDENRITESGLTFDGDNTFAIDQTGEGNKLWNADPMRSTVYVDNSAADRFNGILLWSPDEYFVDDDVLLSFSEEIVQRGNDGVDSRILVLR